MNLGPTIWDDPAKVELLKRLWAEGSTASEIAGLLGTSRNAVLGKVHRMGLPARAISIRQRDPAWVQMTRSERAMRAERLAAERRARQALKSLKGPKLRDRPLPVEKPQPPEFLGIALLDLRREQCRFPSGEGPYLFCGQPASEGSSYCPFHRMRATAREATTPRRFVQHGWKAA